MGAGRGPRSCPRSGPGPGSRSRRPAPQTPAATFLPPAPWAEYKNGGHWTLAHRRWLARQSFEHTAQQIVFQEKIDAIEDAAQRLHRLDEQLRAVVPTWSMARVVEAYQAMRGALFLVAVIFAAEIGDVRRFDTPPQLMAFSALSRGSARPVTRSPVEPYARRQSPRSPRPGRSGMDLPLSCQGQRSPELGSRGCPRLSAILPGRGRSGSAPAIAASAPPARSRRWSWLPSHARWRLLVGHRPGGRAVIAGLYPTRCTVLGVGPRWGTPVASYVAEPVRPTPAF